MFRRAWPFPRAGGTLKCSSGEDSSRKIAESRNRYASASTVPRGSSFSSIFGSNPVSNPSAGKNEHT
jgi:hypothetical protein